MSIESHHVLLNDEDEIVVSDFYYDADSDEMVLCVPIEGDKEPDADNEPECDDEGNPVEAQEEESDEDSVEIRIDSEQWDELVDRLEELRSNA